MIDKIKEALKPYEYQTFLIGGVLRDKKIEYGEILEKELNKTVDFKDPDILILIKDKIELQIKPLYVFGRYRKLVRDISQTKWSKTRTSVQEETAKVLEKRADADSNLFHGAGREDVDVLMLGTGRPFVIELCNPKKRDISLDGFKNDLIEVFDLRIVKKEKIKEIKEGKYQKTYIARIKVEQEIKKEKLTEAINTLNGSIIKQRTPERVSARRSDLIRERKIIYIKILKIDNNIELEIKTEAGMYIKELISGDNKRTNPSLSSLLDMKCEIYELDVISI